MCMELVVVPLWIKIMATLATMQAINMTTDIINEIRSKPAIEQVQISSLIQVPTAEIAKRNLESSKRLVSRLAGKTKPQTAPAPKAVEPHVAGITHLVCTKIDSIINPQDNASEVFSRNIRSKDPIMSLAMRLIAKRKPNA